MLLIPHSEARYFYLSILIGSNNEYRRADSLILLQPSINSCFHLKNKYSCSGNISWVFCSHNSHCIFLWFKIFKDLENIWNIFVFNLPSQLHTTLTIWTQTFKKHDATWRQASEVFTLCIKWPKVLKTLDGQTFGTSFSGRILTL